VIILSNLSLNGIVDVTVTINPISIIRSNFDLGLIIGTSTVISTVDRLKIYNNLTEMKNDGFLVTDAEYLAAEKYFAPTPKPKKIAIGRWDDVIPESALEAVTACREKNDEWYSCTVCGAEKSDIISIAAYIESIYPESTFFYTTSDADIIPKTAGNVMETLQDDLYARTHGQYSTIDDAVTSIMGVALGSNTKTVNSAYTLAYKQEIGVTPENLSESNITAILEQNGNVYITRGGTYNIYQQGKQANGQSFDEIINLDMFVNDIKTAVINVLTTLPKVSQTDNGVAIITSAITEACDKMASIGFIAPGIWKGLPILNLNTGDTLSQGYLVQSDSINNQSQIDRDARIAPPIYICLKLSGAIEHVIISVIVNR